MNTPLKVRSWSILCILDKRDGFLHFMYTCLNNILRNSGYGFLALVLLLVLIPAENANIAKKSHYFQFQHSGSIRRRPPLSSWRIAHNEPASCKAVWIFNIL